MRVPDLSCLPSSCQTLAGKEQPIVDSKQVFGTRMEGRKQGSTSPLPDIVGSEKKKEQGEGIRSECAHMSRIVMNRLYNLRC